MALREEILEVMGGPHPAAVATIDGRLPACTVHGTERVSRYDPSRGYHEKFE